MARLAGIDVGTSGLKGILVDESGEVLSRFERAYPLRTPQAGWAEQDPEDWWAACQACLAHLGKADAVGLTGQMHGSVFLDPTDQVVRPALLWCDQRTAVEADWIDQTLGAGAATRLTGNPILTGFQLPKIVWLRAHEPEAFSRVAKVLLPKDFLVRRLTGAFSTDCSDASGTGVFDVSARAWAVEVLQSLSLSKSLFPSPSESWEVVGKTPDGVPVVAGAGDQAAGAVGAGVVEPGLASLSLGTSGVAFAALDGFVPGTGSVHVFCHANGGWHAMGVTLACGGSVKWARDLLYRGGDYEEFDREAAAIAPGAEGVAFFPYLSGERCPFVDPHASGAFLGLNLGHSRGHLARAVLEGVTFGLHDCSRQVFAEGKVQEFRLTGGGAKSPLWRQVVADVFETPCATLSVDEGPALGAAIVAGTGVGVWPNVAAACRQVVRLAERSHPQGTSYGPARERFASGQAQLRVGQALA